VSRVILLSFLFLLSVLGVNSCTTNTPFDMLSHESTWDSQVPDAQEVYSMCMSLEEKGYELHYLNAFNVSTIVTYSGDRQVIYPLYTSFSIWVITGIARDFDGFYPISDTEEQRLIPYVQQLCQDMQQIPADSVFYNRVVTSVTLYDWVTGTQAEFEQSIWGDCNSFFLGTVWTGAYGDYFEWKEATSICPPGLTEVQLPLRRQIH
jgi:hypothetical protein